MKPNGKENGETHGADQNRQAKLGGCPALERIESPNRAQWPLRFRRIRRRCNWRLLAFP